MDLNASLTSSIGRDSIDLNSSILNNSINASTPVPSETGQTSTSTNTLIVPDWVHCEICKRREHNSSNSTRLSMGYCHPCGHIICRDCAIQKTTGQACIICSKSTHIYQINSSLPPQIKALFISRHELVHVTEAQVREQVYKLYSNMYKLLFDVFDYQDAKWNQLMMHRAEYFRHVNKIKKGMMELDEIKRINKELLKIYQGQEQYIRQCPSTSSTIRPSSVASSASLNYEPQQQRQSTIHNNPPLAVVKPMSIGPSCSLQNHYVPPPEPDKLMTYEQAMIYAHPSLKDALRLAHRRKMSSKNSGTITPK